jgi:hypothetical protein
MITTCITLTNRQKYLKEYFENKFGNPVNFPRYSDLDRVVGLKTKLVPQDYIPQLRDPSRTLEIVIHSSMGKDAKKFNYLTPSDEKFIGNWLYIYFCVEVVRFTRVKKIEDIQDNKESFYQFLEKYNMDLDKFDTIHKIFNRSQQRTAI